MRFAVTIIAPPGYQHGEATREIAESIHHGLVALGHDSILTSRADSPNRRHIMLCPNLIPHCDIFIPRDSILYNLEQISPESAWFHPQLLEYFAVHEVWDYSRRNIEQLARLGIADVKHLPIGYVPELTRIQPADEEIDVLFVGSVNERRMRVLEDLRHRGVTTEAVFDMYGWERDRIIARARIMLNLHYYEAKVFEVVRVSYLLANRRFVISERGSDAGEEGEFAAGVVFTDYDGLADACVEYLARPDERARIAEAGFRIMAQRGMIAYLQQVISLPDG